jgi:hypothetical protein
MCLDHSGVGTRAGFTCFPFRGFHILTERHNYMTKKPPTTTNVARLIELLPDLALDSIRDRGGRKHAEKRQRALAAMIVETYSGAARDHNRRLNSVTFGWDYLRRRLHAQNSSKCHALLAPFFDFPVERKGYFRGSTKPYTLKPQVVTALKRWVAESGSAKIASIGRQEALDAADVAREQGNLKAQAGLLHTADQISDDDALPNAVVGQQSNGRLIPELGTLVTMPKEQRKLLLQQMDDDVWDYDLNSCHLRILLDLCGHYGLSDTHLRAYVNAKSHMVTFWAKTIGHDKPGDFKEIVLSFLNGGTLSTSRLSTCGRLLGPEKAQQFAAIKAVADLQREIVENMRTVVERLGSKPNAVGLALPEDATFKQRCSHILTGFEQYAIRVICAGLPEGSLLTTVYDGFIIRAVLSGKQIEDLEEQVTVASKRDLGIALHVRISGEPVKDAAFHGFTPDEEEEDTEV